MDERKIWEVLDISPTTDENIIRDAYHKQLIKTNPEDDQEGFKQLRKCYEEAIKLINIKGSKGEEQPKSPIDRWMEQVAACYAKRSKRCNKEIWKELLSQDICLDLDTSNEVCEALLGFLMEHCYLPKEIWKMIDKTFCILVLKDDLCEKFPKEFISYIEKQIKQNEFFDFSLFKGPDDGKYDEFIHKYFEIKRLLDQRKFEEVEEAFENIQRLGISHPLLTTEKMRFAIYHKDLKTTMQLIEELKKQDCGNPYIQYFIGVGLWENNEKIEAATIWRKLIKNNPEYIWAKSELAKYDLQTGNYKEAKEYCLELIEHLGEQEEILNILFEVNNKLLMLLERRWDLKSDEGRQRDEALRFEMAWCYFQNRQYDKCDACLDYKPTSGYVFEYNYLKARNLYMQNQYALALPYALKWIEGTKTLEDDGTEKVKKWLSKKEAAYFVAASCYEKTEDYIKARDCLLEGIEANKENDTACKIKLSEIYIKLKAYQKAIDLSNELIQKDENNYLAYLNRQKAYYYLADGQNVINDFYNCCRIFPSYKEPYILAMKVYISSHQLKAAEEVYQRAEENQVESLELKFYSLRCQLLSIKEPDKVRSLIKALKGVWQGVQDLETELMDKDEISLEIVFGYLKLKKYDDAYDWMEKTLRMRPEHTKYLWIMADILDKRQRYEAELQVYDQLAYKTPEDADIYFAKARTLDFQLNRKEEAIKEYEKTVALAPKHLVAYGRIGELYEDRYAYTENIEDYKRAVACLKKQLEINPISHCYVTQGIIYLMGREFEAAMAAFKEANRLDAENVYAYNNMGYIYMLTGEYEKALTLYDTAISNMKDQETLLPYYNKSICYMKMLDYTKAVNAINEGLSVFKRQPDFLNLLEEVYGRMKKYNLQLKLYKTRLMNNEIDKNTYYVKIARAYEDKGQYILAAHYYHQNIIAKPDDAQTYMTYSIYLLETVHHYKKALKYLLKGLEKLPADSTLCSEYYKYLCIVHSKLKEYEKAKEYYNKDIAYLIKQYGSIENYVSFPPYALQRYAHLFSLHLAVDKKQEAKECLEQMVDLSPCRDCHYNKCLEILNARAELCESQRKIEQAYQYYQQVLKEEPNHRMARARSKKLLKKLRMRH